MIQQICLSTRYRDQLAEVVFRLMPQARPDQLAAVLRPLMMIAASEVSFHVQAVVDSATAVAIALAEEQRRDAYGRMREQAGYRN
jgi:hypothetical protein